MKKEDRETQTKRWTDQNTERLNTSIASHLSNLNCRKTKRQNDKKTKRQNDKKTKR